MDKPELNKKWVGRSISPRHSVTNIEYKIKNVSHRIFSSGDVCFVFLTDKYESGTLIKQDHEIFIENINDIGREGYYVARNQGVEKQLRHLDSRQYFEYVMGFRNKDDRIGRK